MTIDPNGQTALYRLFDAEGVLLYIGITRHPGVRWKQHQDDKSWWPLVAEKRIEWWDTRLSAGQAEQRAIQEESPLHNSQREPRRIAMITPRASRADRVVASQTGGGMLLAIVDARAEMDESYAALMVAIKAALDDGVGPSQIARKSQYTREYIAKIRDGKGPKT